MISSPNRLHIIVIIGFILGILGILCSRAQTNYPKDYRSPLDIPIVFAGTFGELRPNHFHAGLDIKTLGVEGQKVYSVTDGKVSRIKVSTSGYGKALYIDHPEGFTSVYGHLQKFSPDIEAYVKHHQYGKKSYEIELFPDSDELIVKKGDLVAYSGNTGGSNGAHLHFELRDKNNQKPINPAFFGLDSPDNRPPTLQNLYAFTFKDSSQVNGSEGRVSLRFKNIKGNDYLADIVEASGEIGFGIVGYDRHDLAWNKNGIYQMNMSVNGQLYFQCAFESFSFDESKYINVFIDYKHYKEKGSRIMRLFRVPKNELSIYKTIKNDGIVDVVSGLDYKVEIEILDFTGNKTNITIPVKGKDVPLKKMEQTLIPTKFFVISSRDNIYDLGKATVFFPANTFYENLYLDLSLTDNRLVVHKDVVPLSKEFTITFDLSELPVEQRKHKYIALYRGAGNGDYLSTKDRNGKLTARSKILGSFYVEEDNQPPTVVPRNFKKGEWLTHFRYLSLKIDDSQSGIASYTASIDGEWSLFEYEPKNKTITYDFNDRKLKGAEHTLELVVTDNAGNSTTFSTTFFRKDSDVIKQN